ncbi:hypothetical protein [Rhodococcus opacus]|uniref:hypothetical protein n=1 Tax=Rhodococcus opacus TaxID=37919 RepID=UPI001F5A187B|nr:hypothetical protein [Rhodococcus opacus]UNN05215.1 hypothetical protein MOO23_40055 [Rhodococcus opacus]
MAETADEEIEFYAIELDESSRTPEALAARDRILAKLGLPPIQPDDEGPLTREFVDTTFSALISVNLWEDIDAELVVARRGGTSLPPRDITVPELADLGYRPEVEVEIDFDPTEESATLTFLLDRIEPEQDVSPPPRLRIVLETPNDFRTHALVSEYGVAVLTGVPRDQLQHLNLRWEGA